MAVPTYQEFIDLFPEFNRAQVVEPLITAQITQAALEVNETWGDHRAMGIMYLVAHRLFEQHRAQCCRVIDEKSASRYSAGYEMMSARIVSGDRVP